MDNGHIAVKLCSYILSLGNNYQGCAGAGGVGGGGHNHNTNSLCWSF